MSSYHQTAPQSITIRPSHPNDEGITTTDNDTNSNNNNYNRPQHLQEAQPQYQHTPHGAMTSILSAADYSPINYNNKSNSGRKNGGSKEKGIKIIQSNNNKKEDSNTKKALRMRASKYFHRSPTPPINNKSSNSKNKNMTRQNNSPQSDATTALATTSTIATTQQVHISPTVTPDNTSSKQSIFSNTNNSLQRPPNIPRPEPQTNVQIQAEAKLTSANIQQLQQQSTITTANNYNSDINSDPSLELYPSASNSNANGYNANGGYDSDIQSNATSGYNSGSDLENAARRIMRGKGKRKLPKVPMQLNIDNDGLKDVSGNKGEGMVSDGNLSDIGNVSDVDIDSKRDSRTATKGKKKGLPTGWRERIQRKTGIELPQMNTTSPSRKRLNVVAAGTRVEEEKSAADYALSTILNQHHQHEGSIRNESYIYEEEEGNDQIQPLPNYRNMSSTTIDYSDDYARGQSQYNNDQYIGGAVYQNDEQFALLNAIQHQQHTHVPYGQYNHNQQYQNNGQFAQGQQQYRQHGQEYYTEDNGAFPNYDYSGRAQPQSRQGHVQQQQPGSYGYPPPQGGYSHNQYHHHQQHQNSSELPLPTTYEYQNGNHVSYNYNRQREDDQQYYSNQEESWNPDNVIQKEQLSTIHDVSQENDDSGIVNTSMQAVNEADNSIDYLQQKSQQQQQGFVPITINSLGFPPTPKEEDTFDDPGFDLLPSAFNNDSPPLEKQTTYTEVKRVRFSSSVEGNDNDDDVPDDEKEEDTSLLSSKSQPQQQREISHDASSAGWEEIPTSAWYNSNNNGNSTNYFATRDANVNELNSTQDKPTADFDIFAWNEEDDDYGGISSMPQWKLRKMTAENKVSARQSSPSRNNYQRSSEGDGGATSPKLSPTKPVYVFDNERQSRTPPSQQKRNIYPHSDGDISGYDTSDIEVGGQNNNTPGRRRSKSSRRGGGLSFFKSRRKYASEGERSDSEWESSADEGYVHNSKPSFSMSPLRGRRKKKSSKGYGRSSMSPLGKKLFGHRQHSLERTGVNEGKYTWDGGEQTLPPLRAPSTGRSSNVITTGHIIEAQRNVASPSSVMNSPIRTKTEHLNAVTYQQIEAEKSILNTSKDSSGNTNLNSSGNNLNISGVTQETERHSNMKPLNNKSHPWKKSDSPQKLSGEQHGSQIEQAISKESILSGEQSGPTITTESRENDEDTISTLGSLVTKGSKAKSKKITSSDMSTVTELSEIEKLRQENARLREELENASQLSSNVVSMYAQTLKNENHRLKEELEHTSVGTHSPRRGMFKSTLETLLEEDNKKRIKKQNRRRRLKSMTAARQEAVTDFNLLPPAAHLINGVDFDDDSITAYSQPERRGGGCETAVLLLKSSGSKIRTVASQVKIVAQDMNAERKLNGMDGAACVDATSRPLDCFRTCARNKDGSMDNTYRIARRKKKKKPQVADGSSTTGSLTLDDSLTNGDSLIDSQKTKSPTRRRRQATTQT